MLQRQRFLENHWIPYPTLNLGGTVTLYGRLHFAGSWCVRRLGQADVHVNLNQAVWREVRGKESLLIPPPSQVLHENDLVAMHIPQSTDEPLLVQLLVPSSAPAIHTDLRYETSRLWHEFMKCVRHYFDTQGFLETPTPNLVPCPGTEPFIEPFVTQLRRGSQTYQRFLPFSPELHLKKLLSLGWERIFEIKTCFRNDEQSPKHEPEFLMLEWYRAYEGLGTLISDVQTLIREAAACLRLCENENLQVRVVTIPELFRNGFEFDLRPDTTREQLVELAQSEDIYVHETDSWDEIFHRLFLERIEWDLGWTQPVAVCDYPRSQAALARVNSRGWAERFEIYWKGIELANAFHELNDAAEQKRRFDQELAMRRKLGKTELAMDHEFLQALEFGMPPSSGIALGLERLFMALTGIEDLAQVRAFISYR